MSRRSARNFLLPPRQRTTRTSGWEESLVFAGWRPSSYLEERRGEGSVSVLRPSRTGGCARGGERGREAWASGRSRRANPARRPRNPKKLGRAGNDPGRVGSRALRARDVHSLPLLAPGLLLATGGAALVERVARDTCSEGRGDAGKRACERTSRAKNRSRRSDSSSGSGNARCARPRGEAEAKEPAFNRCPGTLQKHDNYR